MKVTHVISELNVGGAEIHLTKLLPHLAEDFDTEVYCLLGRGPVGRLLEQEGIRVVYGGGRSRFSLFPLLRLYHHLRQRRPAAVVTYLVYADIVGRLAAWAAHTHRVISSQRSSLFRQQWLRWLDRLTRSFVTQYVVQTPAAQQELITRYHYPPHTIRVIPNVVAIPVQPAPLTATTITCVANLKAGKGHATLLAAFAPLARRYPEWKLQLVGDGPLRAQLQRQAQRYGKQVDFLGQRADVAALLQQSAVFVLATKAEGMSNAILEAMAAGVPCVVSTIPANQALITAGETGLLVPPHDTAGFTTALKQLITDTNQRQRLGRAGRAYAQAHHAPASIAAQWRSLLTS